MRQRSVPRHSDRFRRRQATLLCAAQQNGSSSTSSAGSPSGAPQAAAFASPSSTARGGDRADPGPVRVGALLGWAFALVALAHAAVALAVVLGGDAVGRTLFGAAYAGGAAAAAGVALPKALVQLQAVAGASLLPVMCAAWVLRLAARPQGLPADVFAPLCALLLAHGVSGLWLLVHAQSLASHTALLAAVGTLCALSVLTAWVGFGQQGQARSPPASAAWALVCQAAGAFSALRRPAAWARELGDAVAAVHAVFAVQLIASGLRLGNAFPGMPHAPLLTPVDVPATFLYRLIGLGLIAAGILAFHLMHSMPRQSVLSIPARPLAGSASSSSSGSTTTAAAGGGTVRLAVLPGDAGGTSGVASLAPHFGLTALLAALGTVLAWAATQSLLAFPAWYLLYLLPAVWLSAASWQRTWTACNGAGGTV